MEFDEIYYGDLNKYDNRKAMKDHKEAVFHYQQD